MEQQIAIEHSLLILTGERRLNCIPNDDVITVQIRVSHEQVRDVRAPADGVEAALVVGEGGQKLGGVAGQGGGV